MMKKELFEFYIYIALCTLSGKITAEINFYGFDRYLVNHKNSLQTFQISDGKISIATDDLTRNYHSFFNMNSEEEEDLIPISWYNIFSSVPFMKRKQAF